MKKIVLVFVVVLFLFGLPPTKTVLSAQETLVYPLLQDSIVDFSSELLQQYSADENAVLSPLSAYYVLAMLMIFSDNEALLEFEDLLTLSRDNLMDSLLSLSDTLPKNDEDTSFWMSNDLLYDATAPIYNMENIEAFSELIPYLATQVSFSSGEAAQFLANKITDGTDGFLELSPLDFLYLSTYTIAFSNSIYYSGTWETEFDPDDNRQGSFLVDGEDASEVTYMTKEDYAKYYETDMAEVAKSYYLDSSSMLFIVPKEGYDVADLLESDTELNTILSNQEEYVSTRLTLTIPKFSMMKRYSLEDNLIAMGLTYPFVMSTTSFPRLTDQPFIIDQIIQTAKIDVDEHGVRAASITIAVGCTSAAPPQFFRVDHSFIFVLLDAADTPMFVGIMHSVE